MGQCSFIFHCHFYQPKMFSIDTDSLTLIVNLKSHNFNAINKFSHFNCFRCATIFNLMSAAIHEDQQVSTQSKFIDSRFNCGPAMQYHEKTGLSPNCMYCIVCSSLFSFTLSIKLIKNLPALVLLYTLFVSIGTDTITKFLANLITFITRSTCRL